MSDQPVIREPISNAEFCRFVQEAQEQRARADAAQAQVARLRAALLEQWGAAHEDRCGSLPEICDANPSGCAWRMPSALADGEPLAEPGTEE